MPTETRQGPTHDDEGKSIRVLCNECDRPTMHGIVRSAEYQTDFVDRQFSITGWDEYQVIECLGCQTLSFRRRHRDTENLDHDPDTGEAFLDEQVKLFPNRIA